MNQSSETVEASVCGIIMPISHTDDKHTVEHWKKVRRIIEIAIEKAGLAPQPVWQNGDFDIIQARILKNLFENDIIVCDISTRNPNVMLEFGMRLTTKKPTIVIAEQGTQLPFDTSVINTEFYNPDLDYVETADFIEKLARSITETRTAVENQSYHAYLEHFRFETVEPSTVSVTAEEHMRHRLDEIANRLSSIETSFRSLPSQVFPPTVTSSPAFTGQNITSLSDFKTTSPASSLRSFDEQSVTSLSAGDPTIAVGTPVTHAKFGRGIVAEINGHKLDVDFEGSVGRKRVMNAFVKREI